MKITLFEKIQLILLNNKQSNKPKKKKKKKVITFFKQKYLINLRTVKLNSLIIII